MVSMCSLCGKAYETADHLFLNCPFAVGIWNWLQGLLNSAIDHSSFTSLLSICDKRWSSQVHDVILAAILSSISAIWQCRNKLRFEGVSTPLPRAFNLICASASLSDQLSKGTMTSSIEDFFILRVFSVTRHAPRAPSIKEVMWHPPLCNWIKCNTDGASKGAPGWSACGGIFRDYRASFMGCFAANIGITCSLHAELTGAMWAIEIANQRGWTNLWLECDSALVVAAFKTEHGIPWKLRNRWNNCILTTRNMNFLVLIFLERAILVQIG